MTDTAALCRRMCGQVPNVWYCQRRQGHDGQHSPDADATAALATCPTHAICPPCREGWGHWNGREYVPTIQSEAVRIERETGVNPLAMGCAGDD